MYFQGHAAPGIYARAFLEGRLEVGHLERFRREVERGKGLSSYPHPRLMPNFWEFPTVSMGLGPLHAIYQARFNRYLHNRGLADTSKSRVWAFLGDGETDEPESLGSLSIAAREGLDNLIFVVNCNLQRLDGPVRGNGKIIQELEAVFRGAGWNVIKVIWGPEWDPLFAKDEDGVLVRRCNDVVDGELQKYATGDGAYTRSHFFGTDPRLLGLVSDMSDDAIRRLRRGGHSFRKLYAAYKTAVETEGKPTAILAHTVKGWTLGEGFEGVNVTHQKKKLEHSELKRFRDVLELPVPDDKIADAPFYHPGPNSEEVQYLVERRRALGGPLPKRRATTQVALELPKDDLYAEFHAGMKTGEASTTMVFTRLLSKLVRDKSIGRRIVPIIPDEGRTFGMDALFAQVGIYSSQGQLYEPVDKGHLIYYRESKDGQVLEEGITEAGSMASFIAAGTAYSVHGQPMIPFYIFYSMFGFQRTGDQIWAAGDSMTRGFLLGATAGRTTLNGEGLQHEDGHSLLLASTVPSVVSYDVTFAYELATIIEEGLRRMVQEQENVIYYITLQNEGYRMPPSPGERERRHPPRHVSLPERRTRQAQGSALRQRLHHDAGAPRAGDSGRALRRVRRRLERHELLRAASRRPLVRAPQSLATARHARRFVRRAHARRRQRAVHRRERLHEGGCGSDRALHAGAIRAARDGRIRHERHAGSPAPSLRGGRGVHRRGNAGCAPPGGASRRGRGSAGDRHPGYRFGHGGCGDAYEG